MVRNPANPKESPVYRRNKPTIGFLVSDLISNYYFPMWSGINDAAAEHGVNLICFPGKQMHSPDPLDLSGNIVYEFIGPENVDGIILTGSLTVFDKDTSFFDRYGNLAKVIIAMELNGVPSIKTDNDIGFRALLTHLIKDHSYRRLAYIGGPEHNEDSQRRQQIYTELLTYFGIPVNPELMTWGLFHLESSGSEAIKTILDERKAEFDAVVAANDILAIGAVFELRRRGIRIPDDIAVTGFDDQEWAKYFIPPLTTVHQSVYQQGKYAVEILLAQLQGDSVPEETLLPTEVIIRRSCGCFSKHVTGAAIVESKASAESWSQAILSEMVLALNDLHSPMAKDWCQQLRDTFLGDIQTEASHNFLQILKIILHKSIQHGYKTDVWQNVITVMQHYGRMCCQSKPAVFRGENLWHQARILIGEMTMQTDIRHVTSTYDRVGSLHSISQIVETTYNLPQLLDALHIHLPSLGIHCCFLSLYENPKKPTGWSRLILAFNTRGRVAMEPKGLRFPTCQIIPPQFAMDERSYTLGVFPLYFGTEQLGFMVIDVTPVAGHIYETLRGIISSAIKGGLLVEKLQEKEELLEERAAALAMINNELEQLAYIASHDLQEPLRMVTGYLQLIERRYKGKLDSDADEFINYAVDGAFRMHRLIDDMLIYSRTGSQGKPFESVDFTEIMNQVRLNLKVAIEESCANVHHEVMPTLTADPGQMVQLFQNLIGNAIKFHGEEPPEICVSAERQRNGWLFSIRDNGIGLDMEYANKIFLIFHRLHSKDEYPGTGIGLSVCKKIVERHGGRIWVESVPGKGSTFFFTIRTDPRIT